MFSESACFPEVTAALKPVLDLWRIMGEGRCRRTDKARD
jgi:hypothetical protein